MYQGGQAATLLYFIANQKELIIDISKRLPPFLTVRDKGMCEGGGGDALSSLSSVLRQRGQQLPKEPSQPSRQKLLSKHQLINAEVRIEQLCEVTCYTIFKQKGYSVSSYATL